MKSIIDLSKFLIISTSQFDNLVQIVNCNLTQTSDMYMITYLFANLFAYIIIFLFLKLVMWVYFQIFSKKERNFL